MTLLNYPILMGGAAAGEAGAGSPGMLVPFALVIVIFYFLIIRPQNKKQKELKKMVDGVKKGDKITTIGGIRGTVDNVKDDIVTVRVDGNTKIDFLKSAISTVLNPEAASPIKGEDADGKDKKEK